LHAGTAVGPYRIVRQLGAGGMGVVWLAEDTRLQRKVALKTVKGADADTTEGRQRLMREARAAATLNHPHIATVHDVLDLDGQVVVVFEYVEGDTLNDMIKEDLVAERIAIDSYREMITYVGNDDPTTRRMMEGILAMEEEHADDLVNLLETLG